MAGDEKKTYSGIYCIEGAWPERHEMSARPLLEMLADYHEIPTVHRIATNGKSFIERLQRWAIEDMTFAILYLWYHGSPGEVSPSGDDTVTLDVIGEALKGHCANCLIHFGTCETLKFDPKEPEGVDSFLERTGAIAVSGYTKEVGWIEPIALELQYLDRVQETISQSEQCYIDENIMREVWEQMNEDDHVRTLIERLGFVIEPFSATGA